MGFLEHVPNTSWERSHISFQRTFEHVFFAKVAYYLSSLQRVVSDVCLPFDATNTIHSANG